MTGLSSAIHAALAQAKLKAIDIDSVVLTLGAHCNDTMEWDQAIQNLSPRLAAEQTLLAKPYLEGLWLHPVLGNIGAASLPVSLALACARLQAQIFTAKHVLVTEANEYNVLAQSF